MSTRCQVIVADKDGYHSAIIYRHSDGYPDDKFGVLAHLLPVCDKMYKMRRYHDPEYLTAHIISTFISIATADTKKLIKTLQREAKKANSSMSAAEVASFERSAYLGFGVRGFDGENLQGDIAFLYVVQPDHVEVRQPMKGFWGNSHITNMKIVKRVKFDGTPYRLPRKRRAVKPKMTEQQALRLYASITGSDPTGLR